MTTPRSERSEELLPCPFCGESLVEHGDHHGKWWAHEQEPGPCIISTEQLFEQADFEKWNRRAPTPSPKCTCERCTGFAVDSLYTDAPSDTNDGGGDSDTAIRIAMEYHEKQRPDDPHRDTLSLMIVHAIKQARADERKKYEKAEKTADFLGGLADELYVLLREAGQHLELGTEHSSEPTTCAVCRTIDKITATLPPTSSLPSDQRPSEDRKS